MPLEPIALLRRLLLRVRLRGWLWPGVVIVATVLGALIVVWRLDDANQGPTIRRGAQVLEVEIGGLPPEEATEALEPLRQDVAATVIELQFQDRTVTVTAEEIGISLDTERTLARADDPPSPVARPAAWLFDLFATREVEPAIKTDPVILQDAVTPYTDPETPRIELVDGVFEAVRTTEVPIPDMELLASMLEQAVVEAAGGTATVVVPIAGMVPADPVALESAIALAAQANEITAGGGAVQLEGAPETFVIGEAALRQFIVLEGNARDTRIVLHDSIADTLASLFAGIGIDATPATFMLADDGSVVIIGGEPGFGCCDPDVADELLAGMVERQPVITLPVAVVHHPKGRKWAQALGIREVIGEFTTKFRPGQARVKNIALISELTRGAIIEPGERFSVNDFVGPRTQAKGFVFAGMISNGLFVDSVGGGISQYATTLFNAAFFAGLDYIEYQSHTIYLSRYPYGREATVSFPAPDLVLENNTPYGVMLWPTTTDTSITVRLYSTPWLVGEQTNQWTRSVGTSCTRVTTERTRTRLEDGSTATDTVWAQYRPEGLRCDGAPTVTTTPLPDPTCTAGCEQTDGTDPTS